MNKIYTYLIAFIFVTNCSFDNKTKFWSKSKDLKSEKIVLVKKIFEKPKVLEKEFNSNLKIKLKNNFKKKVLLII